MGVASTRPFESVKSDKSSSCDGPCGPLIMQILRGVAVKVCPFSSFPDHSESINSPVLNLSNSIIPPEFIGKSPDGLEMKQEDTPLEKLAE